MEYTKEEMLTICERSLKNLHPRRMGNRDCPFAFEQVAKLYAAIKFFDIPFKVYIKGKDILLVTYRFPARDSFEYGHEKCYVSLPTPERLDEVEQSSNFETWYP